MVGYDPRTMKDETSTMAVAASKPGRLWEVDAARGVAILMMALYHLLYDLDTFAGYAINSTSGFWARFADATAFSFVFLVGVSLTLSYSREGNRRRGRCLFGKYLLRGARIFGYGMLLTAFSWLMGIGVILFGILQLIGVSIILAYPFLRFKTLSLILGLLVIAAGAYVQSRGLSSESVLLLPLGVVPTDISMPDYRPLLPWFGVALLGVFAGNLVYGNGGRIARNAERPLAATPLTFLGKHSLVIYLIHQPIIVALLVVLGVIESASL